MNEVTVGFPQRLGDAAAVLRDLRRLRDELDRIAESWSTARGDALADAIRDSDDVRGALETLEALKHAADAVRFHHRIREAVEGLVATVEAAILEQAERLGPGATPVHFNESRRYYYEHGAAQGWIEAWNAAGAILWTTAWRDPQTGDVVCMTAVPLVTVAFPASEVDRLMADAPCEKCGGRREVTGETIGCRRCRLARIKGGLHIAPPDLFAITPVPCVAERR